MPTDERKDTALHFRAGVGIILQKPTGEILMAERADVPGHWSLPQGGIESGELPIEAAYREMCEELGLSTENALDLPQLQGVYTHWLTYMIPPAYGKVGKVGLGQTILWHLFSWVRKDDTSIKLNAEFSQFGWYKPSTIYGLTVSPFKVQMYRALMKWVQERTL